jgi:hypothetical protein
VKNAPKFVTVVGLTLPIAYVLWIVFTGTFSLHWAHDFFRSLELGNSVLRRVHSGHPGDYVAWLSAGTAVLGGAFVLFLR